MPKLSICIPTYQRRKRLEWCIESIRVATSNLNQDVEILVSDNNSIDGTDAYLEQLTFSSPHVRYRWIKQRHNLGGLANIRTLSERASGEFLFMCSDDDLLLPTSVADVLSTIEENPTIDYFKFGLILHLENSHQASYIGGQYRVSSESGSMRDFWEIFDKSYVFTGSVVRRNIASVSDPGLDRNIYPMKVWAARAAKHCMYEPTAVALHVWENQVFWEKDVDTTTPEALAKNVARDSQQALLAMGEPVTSFSDAHVLPSRLLTLYGDIDEDLLKRFMPELKREIARTRIALKLANWGDTWMVRFRRSILGRGLKRFRVLRLLRQIASNS